MTYSPDQWADTQPLAQAPAHRPTSLAAGNPVRYWARRVQRKPPPEVETVEQATNWGDLDEKSGQKT